MKKIFAVIFMSVFLAGCGNVIQQADPEMEKKIEDLEKKVEALEMEKEELEEAKGKLEEERAISYEGLSQRPRVCENNECLSGVTGELTGVARVSGYYKQIERTAWDETLECDTLVVTGGSERFRDYFLEKIAADNTINSVSADGKLEFNLNLNGVDPKDVNTIKGSSEDDPVELMIALPLQEGMGVPACYSFGEIIKVD